MKAGISARLEQALPQPLIGVATMAVGALALAGAWIAAAPAMAWANSMQATIVALCLVGATVAAQQFPIHLGHHTKIYVATVPFFLMAALLPPPLAVTSAALGSLSGELSARAQRGTYPSDIAGELGRRVVLVLLGTLVAHIGVPASLHLLPLVAAAVVMEAGEIVTAPLVLAPMLGERPARVMLAMARKTYLIEGAQYLLALLGTLAAAQQIVALAFLALPTGLVYLAFKRATEMHDGTRQLLENMADAVDLRDAYTGGHSRRVTDLCDAILRELEMRGPEAALILSAARVHDIGKIGVPDAVLNKPGPLSPDERKVMEAHAEHGANLLRRYADFSRGVTIVLHHHESWDGTGYPHRLKGTEIPFGSRVIAVADSFDAMTSDRPYRRGMPAHKAAAILREGRNQQWDATIVDALLRALAAELERPAPLLHVVPSPPVQTETSTLATGA